MIGREGKRRSRSETDEHCLMAPLRRSQCPLNDKPAQADTEKKLRAQEEEIENLRDHNQVCLMRLVQLGHSLFVLDLKDTRHLLLLKKRAINDACLTTGAPERDRCTAAVREGREESAGGVAGRRIGYEITARIQT